MTRRLCDQIDAIRSYSQRDAYGELLIVVALASATIAGGIGFAAGIAYAVYRMV